MAIEMHPHNLVFSPVTLKKLVDMVGATNVGAEMDPSHLMWQGMDIVACIKWLGPLVFHSAAKDAAITPGVDIRGVLDTSFGRVPAQAKGKVPTGYGFWCNSWPENPGWKFVAVGIGHDVEYWTEFLRTLAEIDPGHGRQHRARGRRLRPAQGFGPRGGEPPRRSRQDVSKAVLRPSVRIVEAPEPARVDRPRGTCCHHCY
jgi:hypothetical protein